MSDAYPKFGVLLFKTEFENLLEYDSGVHMGLIHGRNRGQKSRATVPLKSSQRKTPGGKKCLISSYSTAQNMPKIAEVKLSSCRLEVADLGKNYDCGIGDFFKSCGIAIAKVIPSSCGIAIADSKKSCACPPLIDRYTSHYRQAGRQTDMIDREKEVCSGNNLHC
jgi:hypothetical protein